MRPEPFEDVEILHDDAEQRVSAGAQGTLGALVGTAPRFAHILRGALERAAICSNDPVCADHEPDNRSGDRATHGAACRESSASSRA